METSDVQEVVPSPYPFKSYYVVWKLYASFSSVSLAPGFKSYYVVWKRISRRYRSATHSFKSYYVVWKLIIKYLKLTENEGLNRTM